MARERGLSRAKRWSRASRRDPRWRRSLVIEEKKTAARRTRTFVIGAARSRELAVYGVRFQTFSASQNSASCFSRVVVARGTTTAGDSACRARAGAMATEEGARDLPVYMTPDAELSRARHFLTGWTLARYASRFRADQRLRDGDDEDDDGVTPPPAGGGAFGWTKTGPPGAAPRRARRRRPEGVLTIPSSATVGQVRSESPTPLRPRSSLPTRPLPPRSPAGAPRPRGG